MTYTMDIETREGVKPHGFHLGTDAKIAEQFALEAVRRDDVISVALRLGKKVVRYYDYRDR
jgi:hypothetical protein